MERPVRVTETEEQFQTWVIDCAHTLGWRVAHFRSVRVQRSDGSTFYQTPVQADGAGFPDLILVRRDRIIAAELKSEKGQVSDTQKEWSEALADAMVESYIWRPSMREEILVILK